MERFIAIDSGKFATKVAEYNKELDCVKKYSIRTKVSDGDFRDDAIENNTYVVEIDGVQYKVGNGARGQGAELENSKSTKIHRTCVLTVLAMLASSNETDTINVAIGLPANDWANVSTKEDFKEYILPKGEITIKIKNSSMKEPQQKTFKIGNRYCFAESVGALFSPELYNKIGPNDITGVIDLGNLNLNATYWQGVELIQDKSVTTEHGAAVLIQNLMQRLTSRVCYCDDRVLANVLKSEDKALPIGFGITKEQSDESRQIIKEVMLEHAKDVRRQVNTKKWPLDIMRVVAIGGTSKDLKKELKEVFKNIEVLSSSEFCNVVGFLRIMCAQDPGVGKEILVSEAEKAKEEIKKAEKKAS